MPTVERNRPHSFYRGADDTTKAVVQWLKRRSRKPFFLWVHYHEPHGPYEVRDRSVLGRLGKVVRASNDPPALPVLGDDYGPGGIPAYQVMGQERDPLAYRARYAARVSYVDHYTGELLAELDRLGMTDESVVVLSADHAELMGEHGYYFQHGVTLLQPVLHIPLILAAPGVRGSQRARRPISSVDVMPTLLELAGLPQPAYQTDGRSLAGLLREETKGAERLVYAISARDKEWCVRAGRHKYVLSQGPAAGREGLYDLEADPGEQHDIWRKDPELAGELRRSLQRFIATKPDLLTGAGETPRPMSDEERERLKSLGYLR